MTNKTTTQSNSTTAAGVRRRIKEAGRDQHSRRAVEAIVGPIDDKTWRRVNAISAARKAQAERVRPAQHVRTLGAVDDGRAQPVRYAALEPIRYAALVW
jgi:hypothetical protein